jgi:hypothetical protein
LAVVGPGPVVAAAIVPCHAVLIARRLPQVQIAVRRIISIRLVVPSASQPPWGSVGCSPSCLWRRLRVHWGPCASSAAILRASDIDNPVWSAERLGRGNECLPVSLVLRSPDLGSLWATVLVQRSANSQTLSALEQLTARVSTVQLDLLALAAAWRT